MQSNFEPKALKNARIRLRQLQQELTALHESTPLQQSQKPHLLQRMWQRLARLFG